MGLIYFLGAVGSAHAQGEVSAEEERARVLFDGGMSSAESGDLNAAVEALEASYELFPHPGTLINLAVFADRLGDLGLTYRSYQELVQRFGAVISPGAQAQARARLATLADEVALVTFTVVPEEAARCVDGVEVPDGDGELLVLMPGRHVFEAREQGYEAVTLERSLEGGSQSRIELVLQRERPSTEGPSSAEGEAREADRGVVLVGVSGGSGDGEGGAESPEAARQEGAPSEPGASGDDLGDDTAEPRSRRSFWRGPWPWIIGGFVLGGVVATAIGLSQDEEDVRWALEVR